MNAQQKELVLKEVSVMESSQQIKLTWKFEDIDSVTIYKCVNQCNDGNYYYRVAKVKMDSSNLEWIDRDAQSTAIHYYSIGWTYSGKSDPLCNMVLNTNVSEDGCHNSVLLSWNPYINMIDSLDCYKIFYRTNTDSSFIFLDSIHGEHYSGYFFAPSLKLQYPIRFLENNTKYEFFIQAVNKTKTNSSFSNIAKFETDFENTKPVLIEILCVSVIENAYIQIDINTDTFINPFQKLYLYRDESAKPVDSKDFLLFNKIDSLDYNIENKYFFKDENVTPNSKLYYYLAVANNQCKSNDSSNIQTNILLYGDRTEKYLDSIQFKQDGFPEMEHDSYELFRVVNHIGFFITDGLHRNTTTFIDVTPFIDDGDVVKYQIKSEQGCYSNSLIVAHDPIIEFPNAFYPQSNNVENQTFYPIIRFPSDSHYLFIIYNQWGQELFRSTLPPVYGDYLNMQGRWNGKFQGKDCPPGMYAFNISYRYNDGTKKYSNSGTFMLMR